MVAISLLQGLQFGLKHNLSLPVTEEQKLSWLLISSEFGHTRGRKQPLDIKKALVAVYCRGISMGSHGIGCLYVNDIWQFILWNAAKKWSLSFASDYSPVLQCQGDNSF